jgi:enoyl-CoA hydratase/carnithine racemase
VHHLTNDDEAVLAKAISMCQRLTEQSPQALRVTKRWLNELDGSLDDDLFDGPRDGSAQIADSDEAVALLRQFRAGRK